MPRDGSGTYSAPSGTTAVSTTTISSTAYNAFVADLESLGNEARPLSKGGTGASNVSGAQTNLDIAPRTAAATITGDWTFSGTLTLPDNTISTAKIADDAVTQAKIAAGAVGASELSSAAVGTGNLIDGSVSLAKLNASLIVDEASGILSNNNDTSLPTSAAVHKLAVWEFATPQSPAGGETEIDFTGIPADVSEVMVHCNGIGAGTDRVLIQMGGASGFVTTGYYGSSGVYFGNATSGSNLTSGFLAMTWNGGSAVNLSHRYLRFMDDKWSAQGTHGTANFGADNGSMVGGIDLTEPLTQIRVRPNSLSSFVAGGEIVVGWRF